MKPSDDVRLIGILPTFRRIDVLGSTLSRLGEQSRPLDHLIVVDNEGSTETKAVVEAVGGHIEYLGLDENKGFAGGVAEGMRRALEFADDRDWFVLLDDDDPPRFDDALDSLLTFAESMRAKDPRTAAVGISGGWFDWRRGRMRRVPDEELEGAVPVDHVAGNNLPFFLAGVVRRVGPFSDDIFFGYSELEYGLRLWTDGYSLYGHGDLWLEARRRADRLDHRLKPSARLGTLTWRDYYSLRNLIFILRRFQHPATAARVTLVHGIAKPLVNLPIAPLTAIQHLRVSVRAAFDGWTGRMGRRIDPDGSLRQGKAPNRSGRGHLERMAETPLVSGPSRGDP
jgi:glycosyltransferase involved in cell wall biosynthesis